MNSAAEVNIASAYENTKLILDNLKDINESIEDMVIAGEVKELYTRAAKLACGSRDVKWKDIASVVETVLTKCKSVTPDEILTYQRLKAPYDPMPKKVMSIAVAAAISHLGAIERKAYFEAAAQVVVGRSGSNRKSDTETVKTEVKFLRSLVGYVGGKHGVQYKEIDDLVMMAAHACQQGGQVLMEKGVEVLKKQDAESRPYVKNMLKQIASVDVRNAADKTIDIAGNIDGRDDLDRNLYFEAIGLTCTYDSVKSWNDATEVAKNVIDTLEKIAHIDTEEYRTLINRCDGEDRYVLWDSIGESIDVVTKDVDSDSAKRNVSNLFDVISVLAGEGKGLPGADKLPGLFSGELPELYSVADGEMNRDTLHEIVKLSIENYEQGGFDMLNSVKVYLKENKHPDERRTFVELFKKVADKAFSEYDITKGPAGEDAVDVMAAVYTDAETLVDSATKVLYMNDIMALSEGTTVSVDDLPALAHAASLKRNIVTASEQGLIDLLKDKYTLTSDKANIDEACYQGLLKLTNDADGVEQENAEDNRNHYLSVIRAAANTSFTLTDSDFVSLMKEYVPDLILSEGDAYGDISELIERYVVTSSSSSGMEDTNRVVELPKSYDDAYRKEIIEIITKLSADRINTETPVIIETAEKIVGYAGDLEQDESRKNYFTELIGECDAKTNGRGWNRLSATSTALNLRDNYKKLEDDAAKALEEADKEVEGDKTMSTDTGSLDDTAAAEAEFDAGGDDIEKEALEAEQLAKGRSWPKYVLGTALVAAVGFGVWSFISDSENGSDSGIESKLTGPMITKTDSKVYGDKGVHAVAKQDSIPPSTVAARPDLGYQDAKARVIAVAKPDADKAYTKTPKAEEVPKVGKTSKPKPTRKARKAKIAKARKTRATRRARRSGVTHKQSMPYIRNGVYHDPRTGESGQMGPYTPAKRITPPYGGSAINQGNQAPTMYEQPQGGLYQKRHAPVQTLRRTNSGRGLL